MNEDSPENNDNHLMHNCLAFFGAITASVSHELNNVISIINQTGGLLDDLLIGARGGKEIPVERLERMADSVRAQTERGVGIIKRLNKFAHSADEEKCQFNLNETIENLIALLERLANLKKSSLKIELPDEPVTILGSPFLTQQAVYWTVRQALEIVDDNDLISVKIGSKDNNKIVSVVVPRLFPEGQPDLTYQELIMTQLHGKIEMHPDSDQTTFEIILPINQ